MRNFRDYDIWIDAMDIVDKTYILVDRFPVKEQFSLSSQITRSAVSIPSNIAEGAGRNTGKDFARFLDFSLGSAYELETQLIIAEKRKYINQNELNTIIQELISLQKRISGLRKSLVKKRIEN
ncbi:four helix bundle protein [Lutibacter sp. HS1-25]|uniref:four helix bundle protein n=1 Tax=Lutibacter sp. HS1-25 TaxID=2485000 RepID=UPI001011476D|nr:four helix bundle protein [Lutibacter sp. HS1-25]RXP45906.1 four helix bundle protein [Lutibacter sp. HS1-25]